MSDTPAAADWWQASDGKWYPPEQHPDHRPPAYGAPPTPTPPPGYAPPQYSQTYGQPQYAQTYGQYGAYATPPQTSSKATIALVLSIVSFVVCPVIPAIIALVFASQASREIRESNGRFTGQGMVTASRIIAAANLVLSLLAAAGIAALIALAPVDEIEGFADNAQDAFVQSELTTALDAAETYYEENGRFPSDPFELSQIDSSVAYQRGSAPASSGVVVVEGTAEEIMMGARSGSGECFYIRSTPTDTGYARDFGCGAFDSQLYTGSW